MPSQLQKFLGMVTYLSPFVPSLSSFTVPLHGLLKKDVKFTWNETYQDTFDSVKSLVCSDTTLHYFDIHRPVVIQVDASKKGLGVALLQDRWPVTFASEALTPTEQHYANIEHELLACIFGMEWFCTYIFGHKFTIESDHKPLEQIMLKNLADAPAHLQQILLCLQDYAIHIKYWPSREMLIADALSCYTPLATPVMPLDVSVNHVHITTRKKIDFQDAMHSDLTLCALAEMILLGWPEDIHDVPMDLCPYHHTRDDLTVEDGIILCGEALIIPPLERNKVLQSIHEGHQGISKCQYHSHQCVYWPGINWDIKCIIDACTTCQHHCPQGPQQLLKPSLAPEHPWQHLGADIMHFDGNEYLIIIDYYSKMPFVCRIPPSQCNAAMTTSTLKELFAEHGIPESLCSDNGPQFASTLFVEFAADWNFNHCTSAPTNPHSNGQATVAVKIIKGLLTWSKYSGQDPYLALLAYHSTSMDAPMHSPSEMLY